MRWRFLPVLCLSWILGSSAHAQEKPWAAGVSAEKQGEALALFREGNTFFEQSQYSQALTKYQQALEAWDHPAIRYNAAVCLINLDQPEDAFENLTEALRFGIEPLGTDLHKQGLTYKKLLLGQLAQLEVTCNTPGAEVTLDGKEFFTSPGAGKRRLRPGQHQIVGSKKAYVTQSKSIVLLPGKTTKLVLEMQLLSEARLERRWKAWKPWAVMGTGAAIALLGLPILLAARSNLDDYDAYISKECPMGCAPSDVPGPISNLKDRAKIENTAAVSAFAIGAATVATGFVLVLMNQPRPVESKSGSPTVSPSVGPDGAGVSLSLTF